MDFEALLDKWQVVLDVVDDRSPHVGDIHIRMDMVEMLELITDHHIWYAHELVPFVRREFPWYDAVERKEIIERYRKYAQDNPTGKQGRSSAE